ncbi:MAG: calcium/sodium antiporter [Nanoarchaeota archaeon]|nr:calcium/sodium antiporter [Nanoarchaeota archaeon]
MFEAILLIVIFIVSVFFLFKGAQYLVQGSSDFARWLGISPIMVGLTIVALGTSMPEFAISLFSIFTHNSDLAFATIIGSNIFNLAAIVGICALISPLRVKAATLLYEFPFLIVSSFLLPILANDFFLYGDPALLLGRVDGLILFVMLGIFLYYIYASRKVQGKEVDDEFDAEYKHTRAVWKDVSKIVLGFLGLFIGGLLFTGYMVQLIDVLHLSSSFLGLTLAALATSVPELVTAITAVRRNHVDVALGDVIGSSVFNILFVVGSTSLIRPFYINKEILQLDVMVMIFVTLLFVIFATRKKQISKANGFVLLMVYLGYMGWVAMRYLT